MNERGLWIVLLLGAAVRGMEYYVMINGHSPKEYGAAKEVIALERTPQNVRIVRTGEHRWQSVLHAILRDVENQGGPEECVVVVEDIDRFRNAGDAAECYRQDGILVENTSQGYFIGRKSIWKKELKKFHKPEIRVTEIGRDKKNRKWYGVLAQEIDDLSIDENDDNGATYDLSDKDQIDEDQVVIIGAGSGRCGTLAFAEFLDKQKDTKMTHEWNRCVEFEWLRANKERAEARYKKFLSREATFVGDVALWNLPYLTEFLEFPNVKVVILKRDREDTINSFVRWFAHIEHFPWMSTEERRLTQYEDLEDYDDCYPRFDFSNNFPPSIRMGAEKYYDNYYERVDHVVESYGTDRIWVVNSYDVLNNQTLQADLLLWLGMKPPFLLGTAFQHPTDPFLARSRKSQYAAG